MKIKKYIKEMLTFLEEIDSANDNISTVISEVNILDAKYQKGEFDFKEYTKLKNNILASRTKNQVVHAYNAYIDSIKNNLGKLNSKILKTIYKDKSFDNLFVGKGPKPKKSGPMLPGIETLEIGEYELPAEKAKEKKIEKEIAAEKKSIIREPDINIPLPEDYPFLDIPKPINLGFFKRLIYAFQAKEKPWLDQVEQENAKVWGLFSVDFLKYLFLGKEKRKGEVFGRTQILPSILSFEDKDRVERGFSINKSDVLDPYLLEKEIKELKHLISKKKPDVYKASTLGYLANISVRKISIYFIEKYPDFFKKLYKAIRFANLRMLANTYINIIIFLTMITGLISIPIFTIFFSVRGDPAGLVFLKVLLGAVIISNIGFWTGYYYPFMQAKTRRRSINTNLPFAIDHMSSVIASGVNPTTMFKLISHSREYGEISIEIEKISNYVDFFGYDILTAIKAVALTTPSEDFKEFLDGFVSTIETGGDLKDFLSQKSAEALLNYRLERQKYVESLGTYSDIYTGVLIAAPLFFVTALSLVSVLGGTIGGYSVNTIITIGTYFVIPGLNILFLIFLEMNQPEI